MDQVVDALLKMGAFAIAAFGMVLIKKGCDLLKKKWNIELNEREQALVDAVIESAVRATEEKAKSNRILASEDKEELALAGIKKELGEVDEASMRDKIKAKVNQIFNSKQQ